MLRTRFIVLIVVTAIPSLASAQSFSFTSQERSALARVGSQTESSSSPNFGAFNADVGLSVGPPGATGAWSLQNSVLGNDGLSLFGELGTTTWGVTTNRATGVFDVSFTLTQATDIRFFYVVNAVWNFTIWTPSGSQVIATSSDLGGIYDDRVSHFAAGNYRLRADADVTSGQSGNITVEMTIIPAPSASALVACLGLRALRRQR